jgi:WD40 repeat protein
MKKSRSLVFSALLLVMLVVTIFTVVNWRRAEQESKITLARSLAAQAQNILLSEHPSQETAYLLAVQSLHLHPSGEAAQVIQNSTMVTPSSRTDRDGYIRRYAFSPNGQMAASVGEKHFVRVWDIFSGEELAFLLHDQSDSSAITSVVISDDKQYLVSGTTDSGWRNDYTARVWELATGTEIASMTHEFSVTAVDISPDGKYIATGSCDRTARIWDISTGEILHSLFHPDTHTILTVTFSPDGAYLVTGTRQSFSVHVWEVSSGKEVARMLHDDYVTAVDISPDGKHIAAGCDSRGHSIYVWEIRTGKELIHLYHDAGIYSIAFSPDGEYLLSSSQDKTIRVWDAESGEELSRLSGIGATTVSFSPDGNYVYAGDYYENVHVWQWDPDALIAEACSSVDRNLTREEWRKYIGDALPYQAVCLNLPIQTEPTEVIIVDPTPY